MTIRGVLKAVALMVLGVILYRSWEANNRRGPDPDTERVRATLERMHEDRLGRERAAAEKAAADEAAEQVRAAAEDREEGERERARREEREAEAREARLRVAARLVRDENAEAAIDQVVEVPSGEKVAFLAHVPNGSVYSYVVERGVLTAKWGPAWFEWETLAPEELVETWADRLFRGEGGPWRAKVLSRAEVPSAAFEAVVTSQTTGKRFRLGFSGFSPAGSVDLTFRAIDD